MRVVSGTDMDERISKAIDRVVAAIQTDNNYHGGLLSRETIRAVDELQLLRSTIRTEEAKEGEKERGE